MGYADKKAEAARYCIGIMELYMDECLLEFGVGACNGGQVAADTAQAGAATSVTLAASDAQADDYYNQMVIKITGGTGSGQERTITDYVSSTRVATMDSAWGTNPDATSTYTIHDKNSATACCKTFNTCDDTGNYSARIKDTAQGGGASSITLAAASLAVDDVYNGAEIIILSGTGKGQSNTISDYVGSTQVATVSTAWDTQPDSTSVYLIYNEKCHRHCENLAGIPIDMDAIPDLVGAKLHPTKLQQEGMSRRATLRCKYKDHAHHDRGVDPYVAQRDYVPEAQGTYWGKFKYRNLYYKNRRARIGTGYLTVGANGFSLDLDTDVEWHTYFIERILGPDHDGNVEVICTDVLDMADNKEALWPTPNTGTLASGIAVDATSFSVNSGEGAQYSASGYWCIDGEVYYGTRSGDAFTVTPAQWNTESKSHNSGAKVQECGYYSGNVADYVRMLIDDYTNALPIYINDTNWEAERDVWLASNDITAKYTKPTGINKLIGQANLQCGFSQYWDDRNLEIVLTALKPPQGVPVVLTEDGNIKTGSIKVEEDPQQRISRVRYYYGLIDPTKGDDPENFENYYEEGDDAGESVHAHGSQRVMEIFSRLVYSGSIASSVAQRIYGRFKNNPVLVEMAMSGRDSDIQTAGEVILNTWELQDAFGAMLDKNMQVMSVQEIKHGESYVYELMSSAYDTSDGGLYCYLMDDTVAPDYTSATEEEKNAQPGAGWLCDEVTGAFPSDGRLGYKLS